MATSSRDEWPLSPCVLAVDPGGTTGWSVMMAHPQCLVDPRVTILNNIEHWAHGQIDSNSGPESESDCVDELMKIVKVWPGIVVVIEDFVIRRYDQKKEFLSPVRITAAFDYALRSQDIFFTLRQQPSEAKTVATDSRLKDWGFYERSGGLEHARDADRHALTLLRRSKDPRQGLKRRALWWPHIYGPGAPYESSDSPEEYEDD